MPQSRFLSVFIPAVGLSGTALPAASRGLDHEEPRKIVTLHLPAISPDGRRALAITPVATKVALLEIDGQKVVTSKSVLSHEPPEPTTKRETRDAGCRDQASRGCKTKGLSFAVKLAPCHATLGMDGTTRWIYPNALHVGEVDDHSVVDQ